MKTTTNKSGGLMRLPGYLLFTLLSGINCTPNTAGTQDADIPALYKSSKDSLTIGKSVSYKNLQVFPVTGTGELNQIRYQTLADALKKKKITIRETGQVNQLSITNASDEYIFILAGDIVKGGKQDRTMGNDMIIPPGAKNTALESYCVESGRWERRGDESTREFSDNTKMLSSKKLKLASRLKKDQSEVWNQVAEQQERLNQNLSELEGKEIEVRSGKSETSLQLALESKDLERMTDEYKSKLKALSNLPKECIGFAYAINGEIYGIDLYNNANLFSDLKEKLFDAIIVEAITESRQDSLFEKVQPAAVVKMLSETGDTGCKTTSLNDQTTVSVCEKKDRVLFITTHSGDIQNWIHRNYIASDEIEIRGENLPEVEAQRRISSGQRE